MSPPLSIVIPVWDQHTALLPRCLRAIATEQVPAEVVIVDNASHLPIDVPPHAHLVTLPKRQTIGAARNAGLAYITGPLVVFADADDEVAPDSLRRGLELLERRPDSVGIIGRSIVDEHGELFRPGVTPHDGFLRVSRFAPRLAPLFWLKDFQCSITSTILRASTVRDAGGFAETDIGEDWMLAARLSRRGRLICLDDAVRIYHRHDAAARNTSAHRPSGDALRRAVCSDCLTDPAATHVQRLMASAILRHTNSGRQAA